MGHAAWGMNRNRLFLLGGAVAAAAIVVVLILIGTHGSSGSGSTVSSRAPSASLAGIPQHGDSLGRPSASATLTVYEDPQCPFCRQWNVDALPTVLSNFVRTGRVKLVYRGIPIIGANSVKGLRAIYAAAAHNKLWNLVDGLYARQGRENSGWITDGVIRAAAREANVNPTAILTASSSPAVTAMLKSAEREALAIGLRGTPTFVLTRPLSAAQQLQAPLDPSGFSSALAAAL
jgi:protein-disulfide isomerase